MSQELSQGSSVNRETATMEAPIVHISAWPGHMQVAVMTVGPIRHVPRLSLSSYRDKANS